jgi:2-polyprenyl-3-methyl-5-hydroxy-6-metoxy-1,4-benzoquinol methylase
MGNFRWIRKTLSKLPHNLPIVEVGSGDGQLARQLHRDGWPDITAIDISPSPEHLPDAITWQQGDLFELLPKCTGGILIANLFWHHFTEEQLRTLTVHLSKFQHIILSEPVRCPIAMTLGATIVPFINHVTRHDMFVSIRAGFRRAELPAIWQLPQNHFQFKETRSLFGAYRLHASRVG